MSDKKNWIKGATSEHPGAFGRKAKEKGMSSAEYAAEVTANPEKHDQSGGAVNDLGRVTLGF